jgi:20S proteasome alpha/beta subunit
MTAIVGVICKDGVVIGSDSAATFTAGRQNTIEQPSKKIHVIHNSVITAGTGSAGLDQRFNAIIESKWDSIKNTPPNDVVNLICKLAIDNFQFTLNPFLFQEMQKFQGFPGYSFGALLAFYHSNQFYLCEFALGNLQPELKTEDLWYVSMGSGQNICDPALGFVRKIFWDGRQPNLNDGVFGTVWALRQAIELNTGGINDPIQLAIMSNKGEVKELIASECQEQNQHIKEFEDYLKLFKEKLTESPKDIPKLE